MKKRKKLITFVVAGALSFGMVGGTINHAFATPTKPNEPSTESQEDLDPNTKQKADEIMNNLMGQLIKLGVAIPEFKGKYKLYAGMDEKQKKQASEILDKVKSGELTTEEANEQLKELGVSIPEQEEKNPLSDLDEKTREEAESLIEDAKIQLKEIGADDYYQILNHFSN